MRAVLGLLILCVAAVAVAWWLSGVPGTVVVTFANTTIETSTPIALLVLAVGVLAILVVIRLLAWIFGIGTRTGRWRRRVRRSGGDEAVTTALVALAAGDARRARAESERARRLLGDTPQTLLLAAQAARLGGEEEAAASLYRKLTERSDAALLGHRGLLRQAVARKDWVLAASIAGKAEAASPGSPWLREERTLLAARSGDWRQALALAAPDAPRAAYAVAAADTARTPDEGMSLARGVWKANRGFAPAALAYARRLRQAGKESRAIEVLRETWTRAPQPDLAALAIAKTADPAERVRLAGRLVSGRPDHAESHLLLARLNLDAGNAAVARRHLEAARKGGLDQTRVWMLTADLEGQGATPGATSLAQQDALRRAAEAPDDPHWRCEACGTQLAEWHAACPNCGTAGRVTWGVGPQAVLLPPA